MQVTREELVKRPAPCLKCGGLGYKSTRLGVRIDCKACFGTGIDSCALADYVADLRAALTAPTAAQADVPEDDRRRMREVCDSLCAIAEIATALTGGIDWVESRGGADSEDEMDRIAYLAFYALFPSRDLRSKYFPESEHEEYALPAPPPAKPVEVDDAMVERALENGCEDFVGCPALADFFRAGEEHFMRPVVRNALIAALGQSQEGGA